MVDSDGTKVQHCVIATQRESSYEVWLKPEVILNFCANNTVVGHSEEISRCIPTV